MRISPDFSGIKETMERIRAINDKLNNYSYKNFNVNDLPKTAYSNNSFSNIFLNSINNSSEKDNYDLEDSLTGDETAYNNMLNKIYRNLNKLNINAYNNSYKLEPVEETGGGRIKDLSLANPQNLVNISNSKGRKFLLDYRAAEAFEAMRKKAIADGIPPSLLDIESAYRSDEMQRELYENKVASIMKSGISFEAAQKMARKWVAPPGNSPHRTGRAIDLSMSLPLNQENADKLRNTPEYKWLKENAWKFGFYNYIDENTGISIEPWHWEYNPSRTNF